MMILYAIGDILIFLLLKSLPLSRWIILNPYDRHLYNLIDIQVCFIYIYTPVKAVPYHTKDMKRAS